MPATASAQAAPTHFGSMDRPPGRPVVLRPAGHAELYLHTPTSWASPATEAGQADFYDQPDFEPFDVVIIDEVSKATPPELIAPMLLGRKVVLVGDHRQLPPMFKEREASFEEAVKKA